VCGGGGGYPCPIWYSNTGTYIYRSGIIFMTVCNNITAIISVIVCFLTMSESLQYKLAARCTIAENLVCSDLVFSESILIYSDIVLIFYFIF
jgi:hypothetical protein